MVLDGEVFRMVARDAHADRLREAAVDELVRLATHRPHSTPVPLAPQRVMVVLIEALTAALRLRHGVRGGLA